MLRQHICSAASVPLHRLQCRHSLCCPEECESTLCYSWGGACAPFLLPPDDFHTITEKVSGLFQCSMKTHLGISHGTEISVLAGSPFHALNCNTGDLERGQISGEFNETFSGPNIGRLHNPHLAASKERD